MVFSQFSHYENCNTYTTLPDWFTSWPTSGPTIGRFLMPSGLPIGSHAPLRGSCWPVIPAMTAGTILGVVLNSQDYTVLALVEKLWLCNVMFTTPLSKVSRK